MNTSLQLVLTMVSNQAVDARMTQEVADVVFQTLVDAQLSAGLQGLTPDTIHNRGVTTLVGSVQVWPPLKAEEPLTGSERERFFSEMEHNLDGDKTTIDVLLNLISDTPAAAAAFRMYLQEQEQTKWEALNESFRAASSVDP